MRQYTYNEIKTMTDQEVYQALTDDFLERDGDTFVRIRRSDRLGWEDTLPKGTAYSERMLSPKNTEELLKAAYAHASDMIKAMNTPFKVTVNVSGDASWTNSKVVYVGSQVLTDKSMSIGERLDAFTGYAVHEGSHLLYTDFSVMKRKSNVDEILHSLTNIIEDEMIEIKLGEEKPGLANFIAASKYHAFGMYLDKVDEIQQQNNRLQQILNAVLSMVRYPKLLTPELAQNYGRLLLRCRQVLTPYPSSTEKVFEAAKKIYDIIFDEYKDEIEREQQQGQGESQSQTVSEENSEESGDQNGQSSPQENNEDNNGNNQSNQQEQQDTKSDKQSDGSEEKNKDSKQQSGNQKGKENQKSKNSSKNQSQESNCSDNTPLTEQEIKQMIQDEYQKIKDALEKIASEPKQSLDNEEIAKEFKKDDKVLALECEGAIERGKEEKTILLKAPEHRSLYMRSLERVRKFIPAVNRVLRSNGTEYKTTLRGLRSGVMDPCKIAEAYQGVSSIYMREGKVKTDNMTIALLIDESGSMDGDKIDAARDTAVLFKEALKNVPNVSLYLYGYTSGSERTILFRYQEPNYAPQFSIGSMDARGGTPTKEAIAEIMNRLPIKEDQKTLLIVVSDGCPNGTTKEVADEIKKAERKGVKVMGISIDDGLSESVLKQMYGNYIKFTDMTRLVSMLGKVLKKEVLENTKKHYA